MISLSSKLSCTLVSNFDVIASPLNAAKVLDFLGKTMALSDTEIAKIIFNETRSLSGPNIDRARANIAHAVINGDNNPPRPISAPTTANVPAAEQAVYQGCMAAVVTARGENSNGQDPTNGGVHFNFRADSSKGPFQGHALQTQVGPLNNSYPTPTLPASGIYAKTYT